MTQHLSQTEQGQYAQSANQQPTTQQMQPTQGSMQSAGGSMGSAGMQSTGMQSGGMQTGGTLPQQYRTSLASVAEAVQVCGWCADQCIQEADPMMTECIRLCEDVVELGEAVLATVPRNSRFAGELVETFQRAAQACAQECSQHQHSHCQECASVLGETLTATEQLTGAGSQQRM
ncbi:four-helix bundle copper-binding protein [Halosimplex halophilum]|uniref:four-helix bundle copper-binding protein n=1 Tax=Halosimplex halophilum TaxID=2559572 RepID=UPI00107F8756|nr:four-helix bundle copper-binding protein [Halosimplex halophilum]